MSTSNTNILHQLVSRNHPDVYFNLDTKALYTHALQNKEGQLTKENVLCVKTGRYTGRSPKDRYIVNESLTASSVDWSSINQPMTKKKFEKLYQETIHYLKDEKLYIQDCYVGANKKYRINVRVISPDAYHALFADNMFLRPSSQERKGFSVGWHIIAAPCYHSSLHLRNQKRDTYIVICFSEKIILVGGTLYSGEIKKGMFSVMNYLLPEHGVMPMHCAANVDELNQTNVFFGLSGTGKTTLSADVDSMLIGDDEHGWDDKGVFNFEGGCYAKAINLSEKDEPIIYKAAHTPGSILENVVLDSEGSPDFNDSSITENTRLSYPIHFVPNAVKEGYGNHPYNIVFLTADAFGVMPPLALLNIEQAMYMFISGYTAKLAGTERGITTPQATFSVCFGSPFMPRKVWDYAYLLKTKIEENNCRVWLLNTGWIGGGYGEGKRISLHYTRTMLKQALTGKLENVPYRKIFLFGLNVPEKIDGIPNSIIDPESSWKHHDVYHEKATYLMYAFKKNYRALYKAESDPEIQQKMKNIAKAVKN